MISGFRRDVSEVVVLPVFLHSVSSSLRTDVSCQPIGPFCKSQAVQEEFRELLGTQLCSKWFRRISFRT